MTRLSFASVVTGGVAAAAALLALPSSAAALTLPVTVSVPEPATIALLATGLAGIGYEVRRRREK